MSDFELNVNKMSQDVQVVTEQPRINGDEDIYDLRRQIEARQTVKDYLRTEIIRLQKLMETMTHEIIAIDFKLRDCKPVGEPKNIRRLYAPESQHTLNEGETAMDAEIIE